MEREDRSTYIGGSDIGPIMGYGRFSDRVDVWREKTDRPVPETESADIKRGSALEDDAAELYEEQTGLELNPGQEFIHDKWSHLAGHCDRVIEDPDRTGDGILEIKVPRSRVVREIKDHGLFDEQILQVQWYLGLSPYEWGEYAILDPNHWELLTWGFEPNQELFESMLHEARAFWSEHVERDIRPRIRDKSETDLNIPEDSGERRVRDEDEWKDHADRLARFKALKDRAEELENEEKEWLKERMREDGITSVEVPDLLKISWYEVDGRVSWKDTMQEVADRKPVDGVELIKRVKDLPDSDLTRQKILDIVESCMFDPFDERVYGDPYTVFRTTPQSDVDLSSLLNT